MTKPVLVDPATLTIEQLHKLAAALLTPGDNERVIIAVVSEDDLVENVEDDQSPRLTKDNVVKIFPSMWTASEAQVAGQDETIDRLEEILECVRNGEYRDFAMVMGLESNQLHINTVSTMFTSGASGNAPLFIGGVELLKAHLIENAMYGSDFDET